MFKRYSFISGKNIETQKYGAPYIGQPIIEYGVADSSSSSTTEVDNTVQSIASTETQNINNNETQNMTDNSMEAQSTVNSNVVTDASQITNNETIVDNQSNTDIQSSTDTFNIDSSTTTNNSIQNTQAKMISSCGATIEQADAAVNLVTDNSSTMNIQSGNIIVNTGDNVTMQEIEQDSRFKFIGGDVDKRCMLDTMSELQADMQAENDNSKDMAGGEGGDVKAESGGNVTETENTTEKKDTIDNTTDAGQDLTNESTTDNTTENTSENTTENTTDQEADQTTDAASSASASAGLAAGSGSGASGMSDYLLILLVMLVLGCFLMKDLKLDLDFLKIPELDLGKIQSFMNKNHLLIIIGAILFANYMLF